VTVPEIVTAEKLTCFAGEMGPCAAPVIRQFVNDVHCSFGRLEGEEREHARRHAMGPLGPAILEDPEDPKQKAHEALAVDRVGIYLGDFKDPDDGHWVHGQRKVAINIGLAAANAVHCWAHVNGGGSGTAFNEGRASLLSALKLHKANGGCS